VLGLLGLRILEATAVDIADLGEEHGYRVLRVCGKGTKVVLVPLPLAAGHRPRGRPPGPRADPAEHRRCPDGPARGHPPAAQACRNRGHPGRKGTSAYAPPHLRPYQFRRRPRLARRADRCPARSSADDDAPERVRRNLDRHPNYILAAYMASGT